MTIRRHRGDLPDLSRYRGTVAIDTETMGLDPHRDRLCVVQLAPGDGSADVVQIPAGAKDAPNLKKLLGDPSITKIFHFARFDLGMLYKTLGVMPTPAYCTKIASRLTRTYTDKHGLKDLVRDVLGIDVSKAPRTSPMPRWPTRPPTCSTSMRSRRGSTRCLPARGARGWRPPAFGSCPTAFASISPAGPQRIFSPIHDRAIARAFETNA